MSKERYLHRVHGSDDVGRSFTVVLPKDWVKRVGLGHRDFVEIEDRGEELVIRPLKTASPEAKESF